MIQSNYHIHSTYCDGHNSLDEMAEAAYNAGLKSIGFTSHFVLDYPDTCDIAPANIRPYFNDIDRLKKEYEGKLDIYRSFEIDYYMNKDDISELAKKIRPELDYMIGSIHTIDYLPDGEMAIIDSTEESFRRGVNELYVSPEAFVQDYYQKIGNMAEKIKPDIIGHIDLIKKNNFGIFDEEALYYKKAVKDCLDRIMQTDSILEVNTGGIYRYGERCRYPSDFILKEIKKRDIPIMVNGDSHFADGINFKFREMEELLKAFGFKTVMTRKNNYWEPVKL